MDQMKGIVRLFEKEKGRLAKELRGMEQHGAADREDDPIRVPTGHR